MIDVLANPVLENILGAAPAGTLGCDKCAFGVAMVGTDDRYWKPIKWPARIQTLREAELYFWLRGGLRLCECDAGQRRERALLTRAEEDSDDEKQKQAIEHARQRRLARIFDEAKIPQRFAGLSFQTYVALCGQDPGKQAVINAIKGYFHDGFVDMGNGKRYGILLYGRTDLGKTGALSPLFLQYINQGHSGLWVQYNDLLAALRDFESGEVEDRINACKHVEYLFIDDFGDPAAEKSATDYARDVMFRIVDWRNNYQKPTFVTTNLDPFKLGNQFHERMMKRLLELCAVIEVTGKPMRELW